MAEQKMRWSALYNEGMPTEGELLTSVRPLSSRPPFSSLCLSADSLAKSLSGSFLPA
jgi:hypothetical protein